MMNHKVNALWIFISSPIEVRTLKKLNKLNNPFIKPSFESCFKTPAFLFPYTLCPITYLLLPSIIHTALPDTVRAAKSIERRKTNEQL
jgi:hypothetical protein